MMNPSRQWFIAGEMKILIPLAGLIDKQAETERLGKQAQQIDNELVRVREKLKNRQFIDKAPAQVVEKERQKID